MPGEQVTQPEKGAATQQQRDRAAAAARSGASPTPDALDAVKMEAWYMDSSDEDQRTPHRLVPNERCCAHKLARLGVLYWKLDPSKYEDDPRLEAIKKYRGYSYSDLIEVSPDTLPGYEEKLKCFYEEHIHSDEEIRYVVEGSGYFDIRDDDDRWIRMWTKAGDMIILPAGSYHRFTLDENNYVKALRLFVGEPVWTPINRGPAADNHPSRESYLNDLSVQRALSLNDTGRSTLA